MEPIESQTQALEKEKKEIDKKTYELELKYQYRKGKMEQMRDEIRFLDSLIKQNENKSK